MTTRAQNILMMVEGIHPLALGAGIGLATAGIHVASQIYQAKRRTAEKVQQAGMGAEHQQAKSQLSHMRKQNIASLGLRGGLAGKIQAQKARVKGIENKGLQHYQATLSQNPAHHAQVVRNELSTQ